MRKAELSGRSAFSLSRVRTGRTKTTLWNDVVLVETSACFEAWNAIFAGQNGFLRKSHPPGKIYNDGQIEDEILQHGALKPKFPSSPLHLYQEIGSQEAQGVHDSVPSNLYRTDMNRTQVDVRVWQHNNPSTEY
jgi:hypothetical protein